MSKSIYNAHFVARKDQTKLLIAGIDAYLEVCIEQANGIIIQENSAEIQTLIRPQNKS